MTVENACECYTYDKEQVLCGFRVVRFPCNRLTTQHLLRAAHVTTNNHLFGVPPTGFCLYMSSSGRSITRGLIYNKCCQICTYMELKQCYELKYS
jgi:hypothetical protein